MTRDLALLPQPQRMVQAQVLTGSVSFAVLATDTGRLLAGATVFFAGRIEETPASGIVIFADVPEGTFPYSVTIAGYLDAEGAVTVPAGATAFPIVQMVPDTAGEPPPPGPGGTYVVQEGDTLSGIAAMFGVTLDELLAVNPQIDDPNLIFPGDVINIPGAPALLVIPVATGADDGQWATGSLSLFIDDLNPLPLLHGGTVAVHHWMRFTVPIPQGSTINRAFIRYRADDVGSARVIDADIKADAVADAPRPTSRDDAWNRFNNGTANIDWLTTLTAAPGDIVDTVDITAAVQQLVDLPDWREGNHLTLYVRARPAMSIVAVEFRSADNSANTPPELVIDFEPPTAPPPPPTTTGDVRFIVQDAVAGTALAGATVFFASDIAETAVDGTVVFADVPEGTYPYTVSLAGYVQADGQATVLAGEIRFQLVRLEPETPPPPPPPPREPPPCATCTLYVVQPGDTLGEIAAANDVTLDELLAVNPQITNPDEIFVGETINIPGAPPLTGTVFVRVRDVDGAAIAGADVTLDASPPLVTGPSGEVTFENLQATLGPHFVTVEHPDFEPADEVIGIVAGETTTVEITLIRLVGPPPGPTTQVTVSVTDAQTGAPVLATVTMAPVPGILAVDTNEQGIAVFEEIPVGSEISLGVTADNYVSFSQPLFVFGPEPEFVSVQLARIDGGPTTRVTVSVVDVETGAPVFATVRFGGFPDGSFVDVPTDEQGIAVFDGIPLDRELSIGVTATGYVSFSQAQLVFTSTDPQSFAVALVLLEPGVTPPPDGAGGGAGTVLLLGGLAAAGLAFIALRGGEQEEQAP